MNDTVIVSFSSRKDGNCGKIADFIFEQTGEYVNVDTNKPNVRIFKFSDFEISGCGRCRYECFQQKECPLDSYMENIILESIENSQRAIFVVPNYCDYPCANFFAFNERSLSRFQGHQDRLDRYMDVPKKFIVISNRQNDSFRQAFLQHTSEEPNILYLSAKAFGKQSLAGDLIDADQAQRAVLNFLLAKD